MLPSDHACSRRCLLTLAATGLATAVLGACTAMDGPISPSGPPDDHRPLSGARSLIDPPVRRVPSDNTGILPRSAWTTAPLTLPNAIPMNGVTRITIHHSGDGKPFLATSTAEVAQHLQAVRQAHLDRGMVDIAYHFAIDRMGRVWQLRWLQYEGQHVRNSADGRRNNAHNIGIVVLGDFNLQAVTAQQRDSLVNLVHLLAGKYGLTTSAGKLKPHSVVMHGELVDTDCPGTALKAVIADARRRGAL